MIHYIMILTQLDIIGSIALYIGYFVRKIDIHSFDSLHFITFIIFILLYLFSYFNGYLTQILSYLINNLSIAVFSAVTLLIDGILRIVYHLR